MYNSETTIISCVNSIFNQTYRGEVEIIIVNDGSKDNSKVIVEGIIQDNNSGISIELINKENGGVSSARNNGIRVARGDWIALLDSDDEWLPNKLERQMKVLLENPNIDFLGTSRNGEYLKSIFLKESNNLQKVSSKLLLVKYIYATPTVIFKKHIVNCIGLFDENQSHTEDNKFFITVCNKYNCYFLNESLVLTGGGKQHIGASGLSSNITKMEIGELNNLKYSYKINIINFAEYMVLLFFSVLRFLRRLVIYKLIK